jgi:hypothetical protein
VLDEVREVHKGAFEDLAFRTGQQEQPVNQPLVAGVEFVQAPIDGRGIGTL